MTYDSIAEATKLSIITNIMSWGILYDVYNYKITALCYRDYELAVEILCE